MAFWNCPLWGLRECGLLAYGCTVGPAVGVVGVVVTPIVGTVATIWERCGKKMPRCGGDIESGNTTNIYGKVSNDHPYRNLTGFFCLSIIPVVGGIIGDKLFLGYADSAY